ncbi:hypothetical protein M8J77_000033 [Diaphorina citri]|nr:hypothetical protein M8J77_000033 [Diaphorina citri]
MAKTSLNSVDFLLKRDYFPREAVSQKTTLFRRLQTNKTYEQKDLKAHFGCVNAIDFSNDGTLMISGGDDRRVLLWNVQECLHNTKNPSPKSMEAQHNSNIFTLAFDSQNKVIFSGGNDDHVISHDMASGDPIDFYLHERPVYGLSVDPSQDAIFASACDDGRVLLFDTRSREEATELAVNSGPFHAVMFNPVEARLVATANSKDGIALYDTRKPKEVLMQYGSCESCMSIRFNKAGTQLLGLRRRLPPVLYNTRSSSPVAQFDHEGYYNSCTMKSCCFAGTQDEYVVSGSDDFVLYMWRVPRDDIYGQWIKSAQHTLEGHRSIVNQVRYNEQNCILASSGVEKIVKLWSPFPLEGKPDEDEEKEKNTSSFRKVYTHEDYIRLILRNGETFMNHDYSLQSTNEDPRMMAFFDSLVQREIEGWSPTDESSSDIDGTPTHRPYYDYVQGTPSPSSSEEEEELRSPGVESFLRSPITTATSTSTSLNSTSSSQNNTSSSSSNSMILFLTDAALESSDTNGLSERTRSILEDSLNSRPAAPDPADPSPADPAQNPIKALIAAKRDRLMKLAFTPPDKRKKKHLRRLRRKTRELTSDEATSASASDEDPAAPSRAHRPRRYRLSSGGEETRDVTNVNEASTSSGVRRKRKLSDKSSEEQKVSETETPDSGIASDTKTRARSKRSTSGVRSKARCYRNLLRVSSSSGDDTD